MRMKKEWIQIVKEFVVGGIGFIFGALVGGFIGFIIYSASPRMFAENGGFEGFIGPICSLVGATIGSFLGVWWIVSKKNKRAFPKASLFLASVGLFFSLILLNFADTIIAPRYSTYTLVYTLFSLFAWILPLLGVVIGFHLNKNTIA